MSRRARAVLPMGDAREGDVARVLGLTPAEFLQALPRLYSRGFPMPDPDTGRFDLDAVDAWRKRRNPHLFPTAAASLTTPMPARDARDVADRLAGDKTGWAR